jgi:2-polyprenyl-3-methyl-5-hydroxy-6-metoxy-1,4-benzoquinol methylase
LDGDVSRWSGVAEAYRLSFATLCAGTVDRLLADTAGRSHLDVGSGTGALAARAASLGRTVVAADADPHMVAISETVLPGRVVGAALPDLPFDDGAFDAVTANFVINHVPDPRAAMRELARMKGPGGRVAVTIWPAQAPEWAALVAAAFSAAEAVPIPSQRLSSELDFDRSVDGLRGIVTAAGLDPIVATELTWDWQISIDGLWGGIAGGVATAGQTYLAQTPAVRAAAEREFYQAAAGLGPDGMLTLSSTAVYVVGA